MSISINCFDHIIGVTQSDCECFGEIDGQISLSGLYIDGLIELDDVFNIINCQNGDDISAVVEKSFTEARNEFMADFNSNLLTNFKIKRKTFNGVIGRPTFKKNISLQFGNYAGTRMFCADTVSGHLKIKKIGTIFNVTDTITVHIMNNLNEYIGSLDLPTLANKHKVSVTDITLPLHSPLTDNLEYFFFYETSPHFLPKDNDIKCGSCGHFKPKYNTDHPYFNTQTGGQYGWANWIMVGGLHVLANASPEDMDFSCLNKAATNHTYGLTFDVELSCSANEVICNDNIDFESDPLALAVAHAIRYRTASLIYQKILRSSLINRLTMVNRDEKAELIKYFDERYWTLMNYIISNLDFTNNDCYSCRDKFGMGVTGIRT